MMTRVRNLALNSTWSFAVLLVVLLFVVNMIKLPQFISGSQIASTLITAAPLVVAAIASTPSILSGGGGIDLSVGPVLGVVNALIVAKLLPAHAAGPLVVIPVVLAIGVLVGAVNGLLVAVVRIQPIVATLGTYLVLDGLALELLPQPVGSSPGWITAMGNHWWGALLIMVIPAAAWLLITRTKYYRTLMLVGGDARAAYSAGINVVAVKVVAYIIGGVFAAIGGLALTALIQSGDATIAPQYTLNAVAAVAVGGTSLLGGRGGVVGSIFGALAIFLIQNVMAAYDVSAFWVTVVYGAILIGSLVLNSVLRNVRRRQVVLI